MKIYPVMCINANKNSVNYKGKNGDNFVNFFLGTIDKPINMDKSSTHIRDYIKKHFHIETNSADDIIEALIDRIKEMDKNQRYTSKKSEKLEHELEILKTNYDKLKNINFDF